MLEYSYSYEKFSTAVAMMATSLEPLQTRIGHAYLYEIICVQRALIPDCALAKFDALQRRMTSCVPLGDEGTVMASVRDMSDREAQQIANDIVYIADAVQSAYEEN